MYTAPHDGRLYSALRQELRGRFDQTHQALWMVQQWSVQGWLESVTVCTMLEDGGAERESGSGVGVQV